jgi:geranylgeranyl diphosphate synthase type II
VEFESRLKAYADRVDTRLRELLPPVDRMPAELHSAMRYSCLSPGKRLRPAMCMASAEAVGGSVEAVLDAACAVEMLHCFSLIHDDLPALDNDDLRRGLPTCHKKFGEAIAILAGDSLLALAFETLAGCPGEPTRVLSALRELGHATGTDGLAGGEAVDILSEGKVIDNDTLEFIHTRKTGALISATCAIGATLGGGTEAQIEGLRRYGAKVGLAFQIADDLLNETATPEQLGKAAGSDRDRAKATYPAVMGLAESRTVAEQAVASAVAELAGMAETSFLQQLASFAIRREK